MINYFERRIKRLKDFLGDKEGFLITLPEEVFYLTGFTGDGAYLLVLKNVTYFITDGRYIEQAKIEVKISFSIEEIKPERRLIKILSAIIRDSGVKKLFLSKKDITLDFFEKFEKGNGENFLFIEDSDFVKKMRSTKDALEIEIIRQNLLLTELGYHYILRIIETGKREFEIASELEYFLKKQGAKRMAFETIVASGFRGALPHGGASDKLIVENEVIVLDFGVFKDGYASDFTRCYYSGKIINPKILEIHKVVKEALREAEAIIRPGIQSCEVHKKAFSIIEKNGYGDYFNHSTGHGVGLQIHELPTISSSKDTVLEVGMIFTVEPGIYLPGIGGIRLEDMVLVKPEGYEVLTHSDYEL